MRRDDEDEEDQAKNSSLLTQHSKPQVTSRGGANQAALQLESKDKEKFVYTKKHFYEAIEKGDGVALVRMLRHGVSSQQDSLTHADIFSIAKTLVVANKPELLAELIRENSTFEHFSLTFLRLLLTTLSSILILSGILPRKRISSRRWMITAPCRKISRKNFCQDGSNPLLNLASRTW